MRAQTSGSPPQLQRRECLLWIVDVQERLAPHVAHQEQLIARCEALLEAASLMHIPRLATEHCPDSIGRLVGRLRSCFASGEVFEKTSFGALEHPDFATMLAQTGKRQCMLAGMEAHVCVLQTALGLRRAGYEVYVIADAVESRATRQD